MAALPVVIVLGMVAWSWVTVGRLGWDAITYLAAGERLNAGHALYALGAGDRWLWINPPYWSVPLLYPPTIGVLWRPLAMLPSELGVALWSLADAVLLLGSVTWIVRRSGRVGLVVALVLTPAFAWELCVGNLHGFILASLVLVHTRPRAGAIAIGLLTAIKLTPAIIIVWLIATERGRDALLAALTAVLTLAGAVLSVGVGSAAEYVAAARAAAPSVMSIPGMLGDLGVPFARLSSWLVIAFGVIEIVALRHSRLAWVVAVATMVLGSPVINVPTLSLLIAACIPVRPAPRAVELRAA